MSTQYNENGNTGKRKRPNLQEMSDSDFDDNFKSTYNNHRQYLTNKFQTLVSDRYQPEQNKVTESRRSRRKKNIVLKYSESEQSEEELQEEQQLPDPQVFDPPIESIHSLRTNEGEKEFYVKFQSKSFRHSDWLTEDELLDYDPSVKNKLNRFLRDFSQTMAQQDQMMINYDPQYLEIDRILDCSVIFPIIHPKKGSQIKQKWTYSLLRVMTYLVNFDYEQIFYGIYFLNFSEQIQKFNLQNNLDFSILINRIYLDYYSEPITFWNDIRTVYENFDIFNYHRKGNDSHILLERMKQITRIIFDQWKQLHFEDFQIVEDFQQQNHIEQDITTFQKDFQQLFANNKKQDSSVFIQNVKNYISIYQQFINNTNEIEEIIQKIDNKSKFLEEQRSKQQNQNDEQEKTISDKEPSENINNQDNDEEDEENQTERDSNIETDHGQIHNEKKSLKQLVTKLQMMLNQNIEKITTLFRKSTQKDLEKVYSQNIKSLSFLDSYKNSDLSWIEDEEERNSIDIKNPKETKYLIKWKELSYLDSTWEPQSFVKEFPQKILDFKKFNRALVKEQRLDYLDRFTRNQELREIYSNPKRLNKSHPHYLYEIKKIIFGTKDSVTKLHYTKENQPIYKEHKMLRDYQLESLNWMVGAWNQQRNVILADEMGLGKTIQAMSFLNHLITVEKLAGPFLILAPLGTLQHWKRVFESWSYMNSILYYDRNGKKGRAQCRQLEWYRNDITKKGNMTQHYKIIKFQVIITSFEVFLQDFENVFQEIPFQHIVIDEAHKLKNKKAKILSVLKQLVCTRILLLTGTPIQNNISELWSLLNFIEPSIFRDLDSFKYEYDDLSNVSQLDKLKRQLGPYLLRRMKEDVESSIPPLQETIIDIELTNIQKMVYKTIYEKSKGTLQKGLGLKFVSMMNNLEMQLRKCCNHPYLLQGIKENIIGEIQNNDQYFDKLLQSSGKMIVLDKLIQKFKKENKKILIFSQFTELLKIIEEYLMIKEIRYEKIDGSTKAQNRQAAIDRFNRRKDKFEVFLLSTKAGGIGINLTSAKIVIIYDSDWNPQNDVQAIARAHRIGQTDKVKVFRLVSKRTYESEMFERASKKLGLDQAIFLTGNLQNKINDNNQGEDIQKLKPEEIELLLKKGMLGLLQEEQNQNQEVQFNMDIDKVIENARVANYSFTKGSYTFAKSNFDTTSKENKVLLDDPDFWQKVFKGTDTAASKLLKKYQKKVNDGTFQLLEVQKEFLLELSEQIHSYLIDRVKNDGFCAETERGFEDILQKLQDDPLIKPQMEIVINQLDKDFRKKSRRVKKIDEKQMKVIINKQINKKKNQENGEDDDQQQDEEDSEIYQEENLVKKRNLQKNYSNNNCIICDKDKCDFICKGDCQQHMHKDCLKNLLESIEKNLVAKFPQIQVQHFEFDGMCVFCYNEIHQCFQCKQYCNVNTNEGQEFSKCRNCNYFYHKKCLLADLSLIEDDSFLCQRHFCNVCKKKQENLYKCICCPMSFHKKCMTKENKILRRGAIRCKDHRNEQKSEKRNKQKSKSQKEDDSKFYKDKGVTHPSKFDYSVSTEPWCRFCGARYSPEFYDSKLGENTLCEFHYKRNLRQPLRLKETTKPLKPESNTEKKYIKQLL